MAIVVILNPDAKVSTLSDAEGNAWALRARDTLARPGKASIVATGPVSAAGIPVNVTISAPAVAWGANRAEIITPNGMTLTLTTGANIINPLDLGFPAGSDRLEFYVRPASPADYGHWRKRILRAASIVIPDPEPIQPLELKGSLTYSTSGEVGKAFSITATPTPSQTPAQTETKLRLYSALTGGSLSSTVDVPSTVPNQPALFGVPVFRALDATYGNWVEMEATDRFDIWVATADPGPVTAGNLTITTAWKGGTGVLRQQAIHTFTVTGSPHGTLLQARIVTERYDTGWIDCVQQSTTNVWGFGSALCPTGQPGAGRNLFEFYDMEDRFKVQFRRRGNAAAQWSAASANIVMPWPNIPGSPEQFNSEPTTRTSIISAINAGFGATGPYVIGLAGNINLGGSISISGKTKSGEPLIIKSKDRSNPVRFRGHETRCFDFNQCNNFIIDRVTDINDQVRDIGYVAGGVPMMKYPAGHGFMMEGCQRFYIVDCYVKDVDVGIELRDCDDAYLGFFELDGIVQDGIRLFRRGGNIIIEGEYQHDPNVYDALARSRYSPPYHPDDIQLSTEDQSRWIRPAGTRMGGFRNFRRVRGRSYGVNRTTSRHTAGYYGITELLKRTAYKLNDTNMTTGGARHRSENWLWEDMYIESSWNAGPVAQFVDGFTHRRVILRKMHPNGRIPQMSLQYWAKNIRIENSVATYAGVYPDPEPSAATPNRDCMTADEMRAEVTGTYNTAAGAWPTGWTGGATRFPTGPNAYRV